MIIISRHIEVIWKFITSPFFDLCLLRIFTIFLTRVVLCAKFASVAYDAAILVNIFRVFVFYCTVDITKQRLCYLHVEIHYFAAKFILYF